MQKNWRSAHQSVVLLLLRATGTCRGDGREMNRHSSVPCTAGDAHQFSLMASGLNLLYLCQSPISGPSPFAPSPAKLSQTGYRALSAADAAGGFSFKTERNKVLPWLGLGSGTKAVSERMGPSLPWAISAPSIITAENYQGSDSN